MFSDDWNIGQKSGLWNFQRFLQSLHFNYWVDVFFAVFVSPDDKASHKNVIQVRFTLFNLPQNNVYYYY